MSRGSNSNYIDVEELRRRSRVICPIALLNPAAYPTGVYCRYELCPLFNKDLGRCKLLDLIEAIQRIADALEELTDVLEKPRCEEEEEE